MKILLTNDDGIDAEGLSALEKAIPGELYVAAPANHVSECSHRITTRQPLPIEQRGDRRWAIDGSPADCVRVALNYLYTDIQFDWVLAGINEGGNLGVDIFYSGTVAAVREATLLGQRAMAFSHYIRRDLPRDWEVATLRATRVFDELSKSFLAPQTFWNVNLPHLGREAPEPEMRPCRPCVLPLPMRFENQGNALTYEGDYPNRPRTQGSDVEWCFGGGISISNISLHGDKKSDP
jgi:5'-nucleotidase